MKKTIASILAMLITIIYIGWGYSESDVLNGGTEKKEIVLDQLSESDQEREDNMAAGDKLVNLEDLKISHDKNQGDITDLKSATVYNGDRQNDENVLLETALKKSDVVNMYNQSKSTIGKTILNDGSISDNSTTMISDFMPVKYGDIVYLTLINGSDQFFSKNNINFGKIAVYDGSFTFLGIASSTNSYEITYSNARYIRISISFNWATYKVSVTKNTYPTKKSELIPYSAPTFGVTEYVDMTKPRLVYITPENWFNVNDIKENTIIRTDNGQEDTDNTCFTIAYYIPAVKGDIVTLTGVNSGGTFFHKGAKMIKVVMYNSDKTYLSASPTFVNDYKIPEATCAYIRVCIANGYLDYSLVSLSINAIPTKASITEYFDPYYDFTGVTADKARTRKVLWLGTSIPTYGYPQILARKVGAWVHNESIGSSGIMEGIYPNVTTANICGIRSIWGLYGLTQTIAQKESMIANWSTIATEIDDSTELTTEIENIALASSYETILDPYLTGDDAVDLIVLNHAYNDSVEYALLPDDAQDIYDCHYMEGAYNWIIRRIYEAKPTMGIVIFGHYSDLPEQKETALKRIAERWNIPYYLLKNDLGWSTQEITTTKKIDETGEWVTITPTIMMIRQMWLGDGVHPLGVASERIADVASPTFKHWVEMYCDKE